MTAPLDLDLLERRLSACHRIGVSMAFVSLDELAGLLSVARAVETVGRVIVTRNDAKCPEQQAANRAVTHLSVQLAKGKPL